MFLPWHLLQQGYHLAKCDQKVHIYKLNLLLPVHSWELEKGVCAERALLSVVILSVGHSALAESLCEARWAGELPSEWSRNNTWGLEWQTTMMTANI